MKFQLLFKTDTKTTSKDFENMFRTRRLIATFVPVAVTGLGLHASTQAYCASPFDTKVFIFPHFHFITERIHFVLQFRCIHAMFDT